ncbi:MAG: TrmH family RNA methyltransferase [Actinomycetes bacterium]
MATVQTVRDPADERLADFRDLTDAGLRRALEPAEGLFIAEGEKVVRRAVAAGYPLRSVLCEERWLPGLADVLEPLDVPVYLADEVVLRSVTGYAVHRGALASVHRRTLPAPGELLDGATRVVVLEGIVEPTNVGAVFRSAAALGMQAVLLDPRCADPLYRRAVKVSMGAVLTLPYARFARWPAGLDEVRAAGLTVLALTPAPDAVDLADVPAAATLPCAVLLGTEGDGLTPRAQAAADLRVRIPMAPGADSLNVGAAAAVAFYALNRPAASAQHE